MKFCLLLTCLLSLSAASETPNFDFKEVFEGIIEGDDRDLVRDHNDPVSLAVGLLSHGHGFCTATLITSRHVITNGHCVVSGENPPYKMRPTKTLRFTPGKLSAGEAPLGVFAVARVQTFMQWVAQGNKDYDVAVITLSRPVFKIKPVRIQMQRSASTFRNSTLTINGYSSKKPYGTQWVGQGVFKKLTGSHSFLHSIDTLPGSSGALVRKEEGNQWIAVGIHRGSQNNPFEGGFLNRAVLFDPVIFKEILRWIKN